MPVFFLACLIKFKKHDLSLHSSPLQPINSPTTFLIGSYALYMQVIHKGYQVLVRKVVQGPCYPFHVEPGTIQVTAFSIFAVCEY
eukprot:1159900-Pelagomonas_calceolata.AAC.1